ncbi:MAG: biopolymer transporter ExbD [Cyanothece sp. SIO1E1]|nr:biopolymer transporter ExbD [Cyanothece sp. SIO1E1]
MHLPEEPELPLQINILPMIDVIFAILAFFIISTLFLIRPEGLPVDLPKAVNAENQEQIRITVTIDAQAQIALNGSPVQLEDVQSAVQSLMDAKKLNFVVLNADEQVNHGRVVAVIDALRKIEGIRLGIATERS